MGAGPIGLACGIEAQKRGIDYVILEKGCLVNSLYHYPKNMTFFSTAQRLELDGIPFITNNAKPTRSEALEYYRRVAQDRNLNIRLFTPVESLFPYTDSGFQVKTFVPGDDYFCRFVIIATGFYDFPYMLDVPGEDLEKVSHYYDDPHYYAFQKVVVVGAMNSAVDAALETWRKGAEVTMVIRGDSIGERVKYWVRPDIENRIAEGSIKVYFNSEITKIERKSVTIKTPEGEVEIPNDFVLSMTGYMPDFNFLENSFVLMDKENNMKPYYNPQTHESTLSGLYLAGVVCGGLDTHKLFIENSREHAIKILQDIQQKLN